MNNRMVMNKFLIHDLPHSYGKVTLTDAEGHLVIISPTIHANSKELVRQL